MLPRKGVQIGKEGSWKDAAAGMAISLAAARMLASLLYGVAPMDAGANAAAAAVVLATGVLAAALPAWRAARVDPAETLRM